MPASAVLAVCCEMPLETASALKAASQLSKFPVLQGAAAKAGTARRESAAPNANAAKEKVARRWEMVAVTNAGSESRFPDRAVQNLCVNRGQNKAGLSCVLNAKPADEPAVWVFVYLVDVSIKCHPSAA